MHCFTGISMVLFPLLDVIDLNIDGIFYEKVNLNSDNLLSDNEAKTFKAIIFTFLVFGAMAAVINISVLLFLFGKEKSHIKKMKAVFLYSFHLLSHGLKICLKLSFAFWYLSQLKISWVLKFSLQKPSLLSESRFSIWPFFA